jgi:hypothetical protein
MISIWSTLSVDQESFHVFGYFQGCVELLNSCYLFFLKLLYIVTFHLDCLAAPVQLERVRTQGTKDKGQPALSFPDFLLE